MEITLYNYNRVYFKQNPKLVYLYKFNTVSHFFQMYFHDHNCSKYKVRKPHFTRQLTQMIFNHLLQRQGKYGFTTLQKSQ